MNIQNEKLQKKIELEMWSFIVMGVRQYCLTLILTNLNKGLQAVLLSWDQ